MRFFTVITIILHNLLTFLSTEKKSCRFVILAVFGLFSMSLRAQEVEKQNHPVTIEVNADSVKNDSIKSKELIAKVDSLLKFEGITDTITNLKDSISKGAIKSKINYQASDSIKLNVVEKKAYLYGNVEIHYESIILKAAYVEMDFSNNTIYATGMLDSTGKLTGKPDFTDGSNAFTSKSLKYNFDTKKGYVREIMTKEGESYLHGTTVKRFNDNTANIKNGFYTTCDLEHPHYAIRFSRARMIPDNKIVSGPAYMEIEDVPTPLLLPFGFFPNKKGQISGIILPTYGESANRGFFFEKFGYYWGINDHWDLTAKGDIYTRGSWAAYLSSNYKKRYKYEGSIDLSFAVNNIGERFDPKFHKTNDFRIQWNHRQDQKARPNSSFSANVNIVSSNFSKYNPTTVGEYLSNTFSSSIAYQTGLFKNKANLSINLGAVQNTLTHEIQIRLPEVTFAITTIYPFRKKKQVGSLKWYQNISLGYSMQATNNINTTDNQLSSPHIFDLMQNGMQHTIPIQSTVKILKFLNWTNSIMITERWYLKSVSKQWFNGVDTSYIRNDTLRRFQMAHQISYSSALTTKLYGIYQFKKGGLKALRHVMTPSVSFTYHPDFGKPIWGYYHYLQTDSSGHLTRSSIFENSVYGGPPDGLSGKINFGLNNTLDMKVRSRKDTVTGSKKVVLLDFFNIYTAYDIAKDSLNWDPLTLSAKTRLFNTIDISFNGQWSPYATNSKGLINKFEWNVNKRLLRRDNTRWMLDISYSMSDATFEKTDKVTKAKTKTFLNAWDLSFNFILNYGTNFNLVKDIYTHDTTINLQVNGDVWLTPKWKITYLTSFDFKSKKFGLTTFSIYRDLHCWEMSFDWVPYGPQKSYNFTIHIKSQILKDLKINKKSDWRDNIL
jgi:hypothetical protein